jgi:hypothetical protein
MDSYTEEELQALPQTSTVLDTPKLEVDKHQWLQQGYVIIDQCCDGQAIAIPSGKVLVKKDGRYDLVDESR